MLVNCTFSLIAANVKQVSTGVLQVANIYFQALFTVSSILSRVILPSVVDTHRQREMSTQRYETRLRLTRRGRGLLIHKSRYIKRHNDQTDLYTKTHLLKLKL